MQSVTDINPVRALPELRPGSSPNSVVQSVMAGQGETGNNVPVDGHSLPLQQADPDTALPEDSVVQSAVHSLNDYVQIQRRAIQFEVDEQTGHTVIKVLDTGTDEVIRQIPPDELLALARRMLQMSEEKGNLFQDQV